MAMVTANILRLSWDKIPIVKVLFPFILGICIADMSFCVSFSFWLEFYLCSFILWLTGFYKRKEYYGRILTTFGFYTFWLTLAVWITNSTSPSSKRSHFSHYTTDRLVVIIDDEPQVKGKTVRFPARVKAVYLDGNVTNASGKLLVTILQDSTQQMDLGYGDMLVLKSNVRQVLPPFNPHQFDFKTYLINKDIWHQCFVTVNQFKRIDVNRGNYFLAWMLRFRKSMIDKFSLHIKHSGALQLAGALIFGYRSEMDEHTVNAFTNTGTIHILSVSGLHVAMLFGMLVFLLGWLDRFSFGKVVRTLIILLSIWFYVILTGMNPPIVRAGIMISFFILSLLINRQQMALNTLLASALFILVISPKSLFDIGFQLSYLAVIGMLLWFPLLKSLYLPSWKWGRIVVEYCYISIAAQGLTLPVILYYFGQFPTYFIPANLFIALPSALIMYLGIGLALSPFDVVNTYLGEGVSILSQFAVNGLRVIEGLPKSIVEGVFWNKIQVNLMFITIFLCIWAWNYKNKRAIFMAIIVLTLYSFITNFYHFQNLGYQGGRIYNVRSDVAITFVENGKATVLSTFDSLMHTASRFSILSDLNRLVGKDKISYVKLESGAKQNCVISIAGVSILILETDLLESYPHVDIILWRNNNRNTIDDIKTKITGNFVIVVDGSNSEKTISQIRDHNNFHEQKIYMLKDNFAYVWDKE